MERFTLRARWVAPIDRPAIEAGCVTVAAGRIVAVERWNRQAGPAIDLGDSVLLPGLINAHTHLEFSDLPRPLGSPGMSLPEWIRLVIAHRKHGDRDGAGGLAAGLRESLAAGVTTLVDVSTAPAACYPTNGVPNLVMLQEAIGFSAARVDSAFADLQHRLDGGPAPCGLSPHAPYTVHPRLLERIVALAAERGALVAMHLAESREELRLLVEGDGPFRELLVERSMWDPETLPRGTRPLDYLRRLASAPRALVVHGNYLTSEEIDFLAARRNRMSVVYCPRTHVYFRHEPYPLESLRHAGVPVVLGTDSRASNPDLSVLAELRFAAALHLQVSPAEWLRRATLDAAAALGLASEIGSLSPGKRADLVAVPVSPGGGDHLEAVVQGRASPSRVWLDGVEAAETPPV